MREQLLDSIQPPTDDERLFLTAAEVGRQLGVRKSRVYALAASGLIPSVRLGPKKLIPLQARELSRTFDRIILDCPPWRNEVSDQIFEAAQVMVVPVPVSPLAARAIEDVKEDLARSGRTRRTIR